MVSVVGVSAILFSIAAVIFTRNLSDYNQVRGDRRFEQAIQVADSGVDHTLYKVGILPSYTTGEDLPEEYKSPGADPGAEQAWVLAELADAGEPGGNPLITTPEGQWATIRPFDFDVIYSVGFVPTKANPFKIRIIRAQYDYAPFVPSTAILTDGNLQLGGNATITGAGGSVHANGNVTVTGASVTVEGYESAAGSCIGCNSHPDTGGGKPPREVPLIDPRENYGLSEYDLCPNGEIRTGPSYSVGDYPPNASTTPCAGTVIVGAYRGWTFQGTDASKGAEWRYNDQTAYNGVYYIYQGSAQITGNPGTPAIPWEVSIFAEPVPSSAGEGPEDCPHAHVGGDIDAAGGGSVRPNPKAQPLHMVAGRDLQMTGTPGNKWEGVYAAHEQFELRGDVEMNGVIIANDYCDTPGSPVTQNVVNVGGNANLNYDGNLEVPIGRRIRTTHWNEI